LIIKQVNFLKSVDNVEHLPNDLPEIAVAGRSNVGKSSLLNYLCERKKLVKTSRRPGKTQTLNYFTVNDAFYFVDIPGFGYARLSHTQKAHISGLLEKYFHLSKTLAAVIYLIDLRVLPSKVDAEALGWLSHFTCPVIVTATKADKLKKAERVKLQAKAAKLYGLSQIPILTSSEKNLGRQQMWETIQGVVGGIFNTSETSSFS
jgi:GTP-binding protein